MSPGGVAVDEAGLVAAMEAAVDVVASGAAFATSIASLKDNSANVFAGEEVATGEATAGTENANLTVAEEAAAGGFAAGGGATRGDSPGLVAAVEC